jgi:hypothetical protein
MIRQAAQTVALLGRTTTTRLAHEVTRRLLPR